MPRRVISHGDFDPHARDFFRAHGQLQKCADDVDVSGKRHELRAERDRGLLNGVVDLWSAERERRAFVVVE